MGTGKKEATRRERQGKTGDGMSNVRVKGENFYRYASKIWESAASDANSTSEMLRRSRSLTCTRRVNHNEMPKEISPKQHHINHETFQLHG